MHANRYPGPPTPPQPQIGKPPTPKIGIAACAISAIAAVGFPLVYVATWMIFPRGVENRDRLWFEFTAGAASVIVAIVFAIVALVASPRGTRTLAWIALALALLSPLSGGAVGAVVFLLNEAIHM